MKRLSGRLFYFLEKIMRCLIKMLPVITHSSLKQNSIPNRNQSEKASLLGRINN